MSSRKLLEKEKVSLISCWHEMLLYALNSFYAIYDVFPSCLSKCYSEKKDVGKNSQD